MTDFKNIPYAEWLEKSLQSFVGKPIESICIITKFDTGEVGTGYWNCTMGDKLLFAGIMQQDAMFDTMEANGMLDDEEELEDEQEEVS